MNLRTPILTALLLTSAAALAEAPTIRSVDMFYKTGEYYRAYGNHYDPLDATTRFNVPTGLIKPPGENLLWDFSSGPTTVVHRFDYIDPTGSWEALDFPLATVAEKKTIEGTGEVAWLFFDPAPGVGRVVYGFYDELFAPYTPSSIFEPSIVDFPETIRYNQTWATDMTVYSTIAYSDPEASAVFPVKLDFHSTFKADAWGTALLPGIGVVDVLRINETQSVDISIDVAVDPEQEGSYTYFETDYLRNYYWLSPGHGIVAQLNSSQGSFTPDNEFATATAFLRMFETNKETDPVDNSVQPAPDLQVIISNGKVLVKWGDAANATRYRVEYSNNPIDPASWQPVGTETSDKLILDPAGPSQSARFYRVVSLP